MYRRLGAAFDPLAGALLMLAVVALLDPLWLLTPTTPTGGDAASHYLYAYIYARDILPQGHITGWMPEVFAGFPLLSYYFPLPFIVIALLGRLTAFPVAFKIGYCAAAIALPALVYYASRRMLRLGTGAAMGGALASLAFLCHQQNSIWGGNLLSVLSGEFAYSYGLLFGFATLCVWTRWRSQWQGWLCGGVLEAMTGFSHGYALLVVGFSSAYFLALNRSFADAFKFLLKTHALAFCLLAGWLWPLLEMHGMTIANDYAYAISDWREALPATVWPVAALGLCSLAASTFWRRLRGLAAAHHALLEVFLAAAAVALLGYFAADRLGLANIRFMPFAMVFLCIVLGWMAGMLFDALLQAPAAGDSKLAYPLLLALALAQYGWLLDQSDNIESWASWNHSGLEVKPRWRQLARLFPMLSEGGASAPRLLFEHDPANNDLGSTRTLESLPLFLSGRPVLEGLYMESASMAPSIYQLQAEVSASPSSPLVQFPSRGKVDLDAARKHMLLLHADTVLVRSETAKQALDHSAAFGKIGVSGPFGVYRLRDFSSEMIGIVHMPLAFQPPQRWLEQAFSWFRSDQAQQQWPVYTDERPQIKEGLAGDARLWDISVGRWRIAFQTSAVGAPHLIKMAYHPRWRLRTQGHLFSSGPGFMLVVPQEGRVLLEYGDTWAGRMGMWSSALAGLLLAWRLWRNTRATQAGADGLAAADRPPSITRVAMLVSIAAAIALALYGYSAETAYRQGWLAMNSRLYPEAAERFVGAAAKRSNRAGQEEALFWSGKAYESAGNVEQAMRQYATINDQYDGYWLPESLYAYSRLLKESGRRGEAGAAICRLLGDFPGSQWAQKARDEFSPLSIEEASCDAKRHS